MSLTLICPDCGGSFPVGDEVAGKRVKCGQCAGVFVAEGTAISVPRPKPAGPAGPDAPRPVALSTAKTPKSPGRWAACLGHVGIWLDRYDGLILGLGLLACLLGACFWPVGLLFAPIARVWSGAAAALAAGTITLGAVWLAGNLLRPNRPREWWPVLKPLGILFAGCLILGSGYAMYLGFEWRHSRWLLGFSAQKPSLTLLAAAAQHRNVAPFAAQMPFPNRRRGRRNRRPPQMFEVPPRMEAQPFGMPPFGMDEGPGAPSRRQRLEPGMHVLVRDIRGWATGTVLERIGTQSVLVQIDGRGEGHRSLFLLDMVRLRTDGGETATLVLEDAGPDSGRLLIDLMMNCGQDALQAQETLRNLPRPLLTDVSRDLAEYHEKRLRALGATVSIQK